MIAHAGIARSAVPRLPLCLPRDTLASATLVVDQLPIPPLTAWGLTHFAEVEGRDFGGIAYLDTFFLKQSQSRKMRQFASTNSFTLFSGGFCGRKLSTLICR
jgi:hypothetical protein